MKTSIITWWSNLCYSWLGIPSNKECISSGNTSFLPSNINWLELTGFEWLLNRVIKLSVDTIKFNQNHTNRTDSILTRPHPDSRLILIYQQGISNWSQTASTGHLIATQNSSVSAFQTCTLSSMPAEDRILSVTTKVNCCHRICMIIQADQYLTHIATLKWALIVSSITLDDLITSGMHGDSID